MKITFVAPDGARTDVEARSGDSVMAVAVANGVDGIVAECGGSMMCATCHCYIDDPRTGSRSESEVEMLDCATAEVLPSSRLSCQVVLTDDMEGLVVTLPGSQV